MKIAKSIDRFICHVKLKNLRFPWKRPERMRYKNNREECQRAVSHKCFLTNKTEEARNAYCFVINWVILQEQFQTRKLCYEI